MYRTSIFRLPRTRWIAYTLPLLLGGLALGQPALAQDASDEGCAATAEIVADAVVMRADGASQKATAKALASSDIEAKYADAVAPLVDWVYTLPQEHLTDETAGTFNDACLAQMG
ncbi:DNA primase [Roseovarius sp. D0-M9]|uniref:DNA primase n=1 Tax=Roseovarius sp. D0-M9 TaxID=3127117 RepID=UPI00300FD6AD